MKNIHFTPKVKVHFMGIGGSGISGVAKLAAKMGYKVTGCDLEANTAYAKNIYQGHSASHLRGVDLVVVTPAVFYQNFKHPEFLEAKRRKILMTWQEFLDGHLLKDKKVIAIAGTHGKSTTTAMAGKLLEDNGFDPIVVLGAKVPEWGGNARYGKGEYAVVEADEFNNNFLNYNPEIAVINNIEFDHPDFFKDESEVQESFKKFIRKLTGRKILITERNSLHKKFNLKVLGTHNQKNANMVYLLGRALGIDEGKIIKSLESFEGIGRRMELVSDKNGIKVYDDYAHHPTAIKATLSGLRDKYPDARIWAVVEAHGYKRTKALLSLYKGVFRDADNVLIGPIFKARDNETFGMTANIIAKVSGHKRAKGYDSFEQIKNIISKEVKEGDVILVMGAGESYLWARELSELFNEVSFKNLTTFKIGGKIKYYKEVKNHEELVSAVSFAKQNKFPIFVLGSGSDILASDDSYGGVVIKYVGESILYMGSAVTVEAGCEWDKLVEETVKRNLQGIECLSGIPGTVGAAPIQNIGAYGQELKDTFVSLNTYSIDRRKFVKFTKKDCNFSYRESIFKRKEYWQKYIIINVTFSLKKNAKPDVNYDSLKTYLSQNNVKNPTLQEVRSAILAIRASKFENPKDVGNAGSFFKNPTVDKKLAEELKKKFPDIPLREQGENYKGSAGWFIEMAGWKGKTYKTAGVSPRHALVLINPNGDAKASDILELSEKIKEDVYKKFGIKLEREVQLINF